MECSPDTEYCITQFQISKSPKFLVQRLRFVVFTQDAQKGEGKDGNDKERKERPG